MARFTKIFALWNDPTPDQTIGDTTTTPNPGTDNGNGYGYGSYAYGSGGGGGSSSQTTTAETKTKADKTQKYNASADLINNYNSLRAAAAANKRSYNNQVKASKNIWEQDSKTNAISSDTDWFNQQLKLQNAYNNHRRSAGTGLYGSGIHSLNNLYSRQDDTADTNILKAYKENQQSINTELYKSLTDAVNDYNQSLSQTKQGLNDAVMGFINQYGNLTGNISTTTTKTNTKASGDNSTVNTSTTFDTQTNKNPFLTYGKGFEGKKDKNGKIKGKQYANVNVNKLNKIFGTKIKRGKYGELTTAYLEQVMGLPSLKRQGFVRDTGSVLTSLNRLTSSQYTGSSYLNSLRYGG